MCIFMHFVVHISSQPMKRESRLVVKALMRGSFDERMALVPEGQADHSQAFVPEGQVIVARQGVCV
jgi:hypothetical protein